MPPSPEVEKVLTAADKNMHASLERLVKCSVPESAWCQAGLRISEGGLGLRHACDLAHPAYMGSVLSTAGLVARLLKRPEGVPGVGNVAMEYGARTGNKPAMQEWVTTMQAGPVTEQMRNLCPTRPQAFCQTAVVAWQRLQDRQTSAAQKERMEGVRR